MSSQSSSNFEKYYIKYYSQVHGYIYKKVLNEQIAEDLSMDVFYSCYKNFNNFDESKASFQTWLFVVVNNKLKNYYRDRKDFDEIDESLMCESNQVDEIIEAMQLQQLRDHLYIAIKELSEVQQKIVIYKYFKDLKSNEIALKLGLSPGNIRIHLKRALDKIRNYFNKNNIRWE